MSDRNGNRLVPARGPVLLFREGRDAAAGMRRLREAAELGRAEFSVSLGYGTSWAREREQGSVRMTRAEVEKAAAGLGTDFTGLLAAGAAAIQQRNGAGK